MSDFWFDGDRRFIKYQFNALIDSIEVYNSDSISLIVKPLLNYHQILKTKLIVLESNKPIKSIDPELFYWGTGENTPAPSVINSFTIHVPVDFKIDEFKHLVLKNGAVSGKNGSKSDSSSFSFDFNLDRFGQLNIISNMTGNNIIIELFDDNNIIRKIAHSDTLQLHHLDPGNYNIRWFEDFDDNNFWSPGQIKTGKYPEPVHVYPEIITIRANWEIDLTPGAY